MSRAAALAKRLKSKQSRSSVPPTDSRIRDAIAPHLRLNKYIPHTPTTKQVAALACNHVRELFFGGAAGGGKSDYILMAALQYADVPGYSAMIMRTEFAKLSLQGGLIPRSKQWLAGTDAYYNTQEHTWFFPSGATLMFGYLRHSDDKYRYGSSEFQFIGFDELTEFKEEDYLFMFSRIRRTQELKERGIPLRARGAGNPVGPGFEWVRDRFVRSSGKKDALFLPSSLSDNPHLDREEYLKNLANLDPIMQKKLRDGDWSDLLRGDVFPKTSARLIDRVPEPILKQVWGWDYACTEPHEGNKDPDYLCGVHMGIGAETGRIYIMDRRKARENPGEVERLIRRTAVLSTKAVPHRMEGDPAAMGKATIHHYAVSVLLGYDFAAHPIRGSKIERGGPLASQWRQGNVYVVRAEWTDDYLAQMDGFPHLKHDDDADASSCAFNALADITAPENWETGPRIT